MQLRDTFWPLMVKNITPAATKKLTAAIAAYVDRNSDILMSLDMSRRFSFGDADRAVVYEAIGTTEEDVLEAVSRSKEIYQGNRIQSNPFYLMSALLTGYYITKNDVKTAGIVWTYTSLMMYVSIHKGLYKYDANQAVMDYTIAHLDNTFSIREFPSIFAFIQDNTKTVLETYKSRYSRCTDRDATWVIDANWTRLKGKMKKIAAKFYDNHKSGRYLNSDTDSFDSEDYHQMDNVSFATDRLVNRVYIKLINHQYDKRFIKYSMSGSDTSYNKVLNLIDDIIDGDGDSGSMRKLIDEMIKFYLLQSGKPISYLGKGDFIVYMRTAFASNTAAKEMEFIKSTIDRWLKDNMYKYGRANYGKTVQIMYRRTIYMFFVFMINYEAKLQ